MRVHKGLQLLWHAAIWLALCIPAIAFGLGEYEFELEELSTSQVLDMDLLTDSKPLVIFAWAPDCPHCKRHMPYVAALYKKLNKDSTNFATISMSDDRKATLSYMDEKQLVFPVMLASTGEVGDGFTELGWPTTFVFSADGKLTGICETSGPAYITEVLELVEKAED